MLMISSALANQPVFLLMLIKHISKDLDVQFELRRYSRSIDNGELVSEWHHGNWSWNIQGLQSPTTKVLAILEAMKLLVKCFYRLEIWFVIELWGEDECQFFG